MYLKKRQKQLKIQKTFKNGPFIWYFIMKCKSILVCCILISVYNWISAQDESFTLTEPVAGDCLLLRSTTKFVWEVTNENSKMKLEILIAKGRDTLHIKKNALYKKGYGFYPMPYKILPGSDYQIILRNQSTLQVLSVVKPLYVSLKMMGNTNPKPIIHDLALGWNPSLIIDSTKMRLVNLEYLQKKSLIDINIEDNRRHIFWVGGYYDSEKPKILVFTKDTASVWLRNKFYALFNDLDMQVTQSGTYSLQLSLLDFIVKESHFYDCHIMVRAKIVDRNNEIIWDGIIRRNHSAWGSTYNRKMYQQVIADTFLELAISVIENISLALKNIKD